MTMLSHELKPSPIGLLDVIGHSQFMSVLEQNWVILQAVGQESNYGWSAFSLVGDRVLPNQETTKVSATEIGASPIWLDFEMSAFCPIRPNRLVKIQFDTGF